jgi:hypothetical protein
MNKNSLRAAFVAGAAYLSLAVLLALAPPIEGEFTTLNSVSDALFLLALVSSMIAMLALATTLELRRAGILYCCGATILCVGVVAGVVAGHELSWFMFAGIPGNVLALISTVWLAVRARRTEALPMTLVVLLGLYIPIGIGLAGIGGTIVPALFWFGISFGKAPELKPLAATA